MLILKIYMCPHLFFRREKFEQLLNDYQSEVDIYQEKEVPRHLEDIKKVVTQLDQLSENLEKSKEEAMVSHTPPAQYKLEFYTHITFICRVYANKAHDLICTRKFTFWDFSYCILM